MKLTVALFVCAGCLAVGVISNSWRVFPSSQYGDARVGLRHVTECYQGSCRTTPDELPASGTVTLALGVAELIACFVCAVAQKTIGTPRGDVAVLVLGGCCLLSAIVFLFQLPADLRDHTSLGYAAILYLCGSLAASVAGFVARLSRISVRVES